MSDTQPFRDVPERAGDASLFTCWWSMLEAHQECADLPPIHDDDLILHFNGSGASCMVFAKDIRAAVKEINTFNILAQPINAVFELPSRRDRDMARAALIHDLREVITCIEDDCNEEAAAMLKHIIGDDDA